MVITAYAVMPSGSCGFSKQTHGTAHGQREGGEERPQNRNSEMQVEPTAWLPPSGRAVSLTLPDCSHPHRRHAPKGLFGVRPRLEVIQGQGQGSGGCCDPFGGPSAVEERR